MKFELIFNLISKVIISASSFEEAEKIGEQMLKKDLSSIIHAAQNNRELHFLENIKEK